MGNRIQNGMAWLGLWAAAMVYVGGLQAAIPLVIHNDHWLFKRGTNPPPSLWKTMADLSLPGDWSGGPGGFGFGTTQAETNLCGTLLPDMRGTAPSNYTTLYVRRTFTITNGIPREWRLKLRMDWDDGFIAWLDGVYLTNNASPNAPQEPPYDSTALNAAAGGHESSGGQNPNPAAVYDLGTVGTRAGDGEHILALMGLNVSDTSGDFILVADLFAVPDEAPPAVTNGIGGWLLADTTLYSSNSVYTLTNSLVVSSNVTLRIEPGVTIQARKGTGITVFGGLIAAGEADRRITFTRYPTDRNWERLLFVKAQDSSLRHCVIEYANCAGDHKDYYATNCAFPTNAGPRQYKEAVVGLGCHVELDHCVFQNLFTEDGSKPEGDAVALISDDLEHGGPASANIRSCQFLGIGQGIHTRYAYVLVEQCYFVGKTGDNDDVDLYGESTLYGLPSPVIRSNIFDTPCYDDRINPTRCSAVIQDNLIYGDPSRGDHAIVLRDVCNPIVFNNVITDCPAGGISVQNGCDALIVNNTFYNIDSAIKLFDHQGRVGQPYCLSQLSGRATVVNCIVWNGSRAIDLSGAAGAPFDKFRVEAAFCNLQGGTNALYTGANTRFEMTWGPGITDQDPLFRDPATRDFRLSTNSPCIDAGTTNMGSYVTTNAVLVGTNRVRFAVTNELGNLISHDLAGMPRPLDGNLDRGPRFDQGAFEVLHDEADSNLDGIPDGWLWRHGFDPLSTTSRNADPDHDGYINWFEYLADTQPLDESSYLRLASTLAGGKVRFSFRSSADRTYTLMSSRRWPAAEVEWTPVGELTNVRGTGGLMEFEETVSGDSNFYRLEVRMP